MAGYEHPAVGAEETLDLTIQSFLHRPSIWQPQKWGWGCSCPRLALVGLGRAEEAPPMPIDLRRRDDITAAVEAHNLAHPAARLPRPAARLLAVMFATEDVCCRSQWDLEGEGFGKPLSCLLRALVEAGFVSKQRGSSRIPDTYRLQALRP
jgi:hypothetical protein